MDHASPERRTTRRTISFVAMVALVAGTLALAPSAAGAQPPCRVKNMATLVVYDGSGSNLQVAIDEADPSVRLRVKGVCVGEFIIGQDLGLIGKTSPAYPTQASLDGSDLGTVLWVKMRVAVALRDLTVTHGMSWDNVGGIRNGGRLSLKGSTLVTGNTAAGNGGGIYNSNYGTLTLNGSSSVSGNTAFHGAGIANAGTLTLNGSSSVTGNAAGGSGGGIVNVATLTLNDSSSVTGNTADGSGGGISNEGTAIMNDASSVSGNTADADDANEGEGGGISNSCSATLTNANDGGNVNDNYRGTAAPVEDNIAYQTPCAATRVRSL